MNALGVTHRIDSIGAPLGRRLADDAARDGAASDTFDSLLADLPQAPPTQQDDRLASALADAKGPNLAASDAQGGEPVKLQAPSESDLRELLRLAAQQPIPVSCKGNSASSALSPRTASAPSAQGEASKIVAPAKGRTERPAPDWTAISALKSRSLSEMEQIGAGAGKPADPSPEKPIRAEDGARAEMEASRDEQDSLSAEHPALVLQHSDNSKAVRMVCGDEPRQAEDDAIRLAGGRETKPSRRDQTSAISAQPATHAMALAPTPFLQVEIAAPRAFPNPPRTSAPVAAVRSERLSVALSPSPLSPSPLSSSPQSSSLSSPSLSPPSLQSSSLQSPSLPPLSRDDSNRPTPALLFNLDAPKTSVHVVDLKTWLPPVQTHLPSAIDERSAPEAKIAIRPISGADETEGVQKPADRPMQNFPIAADALVKAGGAEPAPKASAAPPTSPVAATLAQAAPAMRAPRRDLEVTLEPQGLGGLSVRLKSMEDRLDVAFIADKRVTAQMIGDGSRALEAQLRGAGLGPAGVDISVAANSGARASIDSGMTGANSFTASRDDGSPAPRHQEFTERHQEDAKDETGDQAQDSRARGHRGLYL
jgi:hypothetical protein